TLPDPPSSTADGSIIDPASPEPGPKPGSILDVWRRFVPPDFEPPAPPASPQTPVLDSPYTGEGGGPVAYSGHGGAPGGFVPPRDRGIPTGPDLREYGAGGGPRRYTAAMFGEFFHGAAKIP